MKRRIAAGLMVATMLAGGCSSAPQDPRTRAFASLPDWSGIWVVEGPGVGPDGFIQIGVDPDAPIDGPGPSPLYVFNLAAPFTPQGAATVRGILAEVGDNVAQTKDGSGGWGYPLMMQSPAPMQFLITPEETLVLNVYRDARRIYTDGRSRPAEEDRWPPTTWGDSLGHWEGDTLVIETIDVREPREYFGLSLPFSSQARYTERLRRTGPERIEGEMVIEDPVLLAAPMKIPLAYRLETQPGRMVLDSFSDNRTGFDGEFNTIEPER